MLPGRHPADHARLLCRHHPRIPWDSDEIKLLFGIPFGYPDDDAPGHRVRMDRVPLDTSVTFHA